MPTERHYEVADFCVNASTQILHLFDIASISSINIVYVYDVSQHDKCH